MRRLRANAPAAVLAGAAMWVVWLSVSNGRAQQRKPNSIKLGAAPLVGRNDADGWVWRFSCGTAGAIAVAILLALSCRLGWWWRMRQRWILLVTTVGSALFATLLALTDGFDGLRYGAAHPTEYLANLRYMPPADRFVRSFIHQLDYYSVHARGHPPGYLLLLKWLDGLGFYGVWPVVVVSICATGLTAAAVVSTVRSVCGDEWMRRVAPLLIVAPFAIWMLTSADAVFACVGAIAVAAIAEGLNRTGWQSFAFGIAGGSLFGAMLFLTYLAAVWAIIPATLVVFALIRRWRHTWPLAVGATVAAGAVVVAFWIAGFWWFDGVAATNKQYRAGTAQFREWNYFVYGNLGAAVFALGPATVIGLGKLRNKRLWPLIAAAAAALLVAHFSRYTKGEVERIWLIFFPWIAIAAAALVTQARRWSGATVVALQAGCAITLQAALLSKW